MTGNELKMWRGSIGFRQEDLARELEVAVSSVARWEQLIDDEIPNSKMLELALKEIKNSHLSPEINFKNEDDLDFESCYRQIEELSEHIHSRENGWRFKTIERTEVIKTLLEFQKFTQILINIILENQNDLPKKTIAYNFPLRDFVEGLRGLVSLVMITKEFERSDS